LVCPVTAALSEECIPTVDTVLKVRFILGMSNCFAKAHIGSRLDVSNQYQYSTEIFAYMQVPA